MSAPPTFEDLYQPQKRQPNVRERGAEIGIAKDTVSVRRGVADANVAEQTAPTTVQTNQAPDGYMWVDPRDPEKGVKAIPGYTKTDKTGGAEKRGERLRASLEALQKARVMAQKTLAIGSASEFLQGVPVINQNRRNMESLLRNAEATIIGDMLESLAAANPSGVSGMFNTDVEARRMGAQIAALDPNQDYPALMAQIQKAEDYFLQEAARAEGLNEVTGDLRLKYLPEDRIKELAAGQPEAKQLSEDGTQLLPVPDWYQQAHYRYLEANRDKLDPSQYAAFRAGLDEQAGFTPDLPGYVTAAEGIREFFKQGGKPGELGAVPGPREDLSAYQQGVTDFAQTPFGAGTMSAITSATAGLPVALAGKQEEMEAVRQNQPLASGIGDFIGGAAGTVGLGAISNAAGITNRVLGSPALQDAAFSFLSGATQAEDPIKGGLYGVGGSLLGEAGGRMIGRALPDSFAGGAMREARESVPSSGQLGNEADRLYREAAATGQQIQPRDTDAFIADTEQFLRTSGFMDADGNLLGTGPVQDGYRMLKSFEGRPIGPVEAQTIRNKLAEGRTAMREGAPDNAARMFSGELTSRFDNFAEAANALPGIAKAREVAQRRIMGREMDRATELGTARGEINYSQGGEDLGIRRAFGNLDTSEVRGTRMYPQDVEDAIRVVSRGTPARDVAQGFGRLSPQGGTGLGTGALTGVGIGTLSGDPVMGGAATAALYGAGLLGRKAAGAMARKDAELASLIARGGPRFKSLMDAARAQAGTTGGRVFAGGTGAVAAIPTRDDYQNELSGMGERYSDEEVAEAAAILRAAPPEEGGFQNVTAAGDTIEPQQTTRVINGRVTDIDPVTGERVYVDTGEPVEMKRGGAVRGYKQGGRVGGGQGMSEEAVNRMVTQMVVGGKSADDIRQYLDSIEPGLGARAQNLEANIKYVQENEGAQPRSSIKFTSPVEDAMFAAGRRGADALGMGADYLDTISRRFLNQRGGFREGLDQRWGNVARRNYERGALGAQPPEEAMNPARLADLGYRPGDVGEGLRTQTPRLAEMAGRYLSEVTPSGAVRDAKRAGSAAWEMIKEDPYGMAFDSVLYASPFSAPLVAAADGAHLRGAARGMAPYADMVGEDGQPLIDPNMRQMIDAAAILPAIGLPGTGTYAKGAAKLAAKPVRRRKRGGAVR
jgi:hypothetical protein